MNDQTVLDGAAVQSLLKGWAQPSAHARSQLLHLCAFDGEEILEVGVLGTDLSLQLTSTAILPAFTLSIFSNWRMTTQLARYR